MVTIERPWAPDLNPTFTPMTELQTKAFMVATMAELESERTGKEFPLDDSIINSFPFQVLIRRINVRNLPIKFSPEGMFAACLALAPSPGGLMLLLIDCLNAHEGETITPEHLAHLYPFGFYSQETIERYVDEFVKTRKVKWSHIY